MEFSTAILILTHRCNYECLHCYDYFNTDEISTDEIIINTKQLLNKLKDDGIKRILFSGGECTLLSDLKELIHYAKELGFYVSIFSNGSCNDYETYLSADEIMLSVDGSKEYHNYLRNNDFAYDKLLKLLKYLDLNNKLVGFQVSVTKHNMDNLGFVKDFVKKFSCVKHISFSAINPIGNALNSPDLLLTDKDYRKILNNIEDILKSVHYHLKIKTNIVDSISIGMYTSLSTTTRLPIFFDIPKDCYYIFSDEINSFTNILNYDLNEISSVCIEIVEKLKHYDSFDLKHLYNIEELILKGGE
ncbi:MAG: radical SAM protein [Paraclostridium sp.]